MIRIPCLRLLYACASRFEAKLDAALAKLDEILAQLAGQDRKLDRITDQLARLQEPSPEGQRKGRVQAQRSISTCNSAPEGICGWIAWKLVSAYAAAPLAISHPACF